MVERTHEKSSARNLIFLSLVLMLFGSCTRSSEGANKSTTDFGTSDCIIPKESVEKKSQLERGIRGQVKFLGESENFSSITDKILEYNIPALSLAVIHQGKIEWADTYLNANFPEESKLDCASIFQAASLSKPVTVLAAMRMHATGAIDLDQNIQEYLKDYVLPPGKQTAENPVTLRNIFSHTSGITSGGYEGYSKDLPLPSDIDILQGASGVNSPPIEVVNPPNETLAYSGGAYTLAEVALQDIFANEFSDFMKEWILEPAGMKHSAFTQPLITSKPNQVVRGYTQSGTVLEGGWRNHPEQAAAGLWSNASDLAKFLLEIYNAYQGKSSIFSQSVIKSMLEDERDGLVYGFIINRSNDDISLTHYGGNAGYRTGMTISLTTGNGLVYLIDSDNGGNLGNELLLSAAQVYEWPHFQQMEVQRTNVSSEVLKQLPGEYKWNDQINLSISIYGTEDAISLHFPNGDAYELTPIRGEQLDFIHSGTGVRVSFLKDEEFQSFELYGQKAVRKQN